MAKERKHYDKFLLRDRERLIFARDALRQKIVTHKSYQTEVQRLVDKENHRIKDELM